MTALPLDLHRPGDSGPPARWAIGPVGTTVALADRFAAIRGQTLALAEGLSEADCQAQSMPDASPVKWHLAHTTWFFETFVLERFERGFAPHHPAFRVLFNSYYNGVGEQHPRPQRGLVTRPGLREVLDYRAAVDARMAALLQDGLPAQAQALVELGLQHEQQHQELILTDFKHLLAQNPLQPVYRAGWPLAPVAPVPQGFVDFVGGKVEIGHAGGGFAFDNESPRHAVWLAPYSLARRLVTHGEYAAFMADGGYGEPRWWLSAGWDWVRTQAAQAPLYWRREGSGPLDWSAFTLHGRVPIDPHTPAVHLNLYEADAFARWWSAQHPGQPAARLPTEAEWEHAAQCALGMPSADPMVDTGPTAPALRLANFVESRALHPLPLREPHEGAMQLFGDVWEWTGSSYSPYPGFVPWAGAAGEYNGKFMVNQYVLRGGSCATPRSHIRASYRNFFPADARWQFSGLRLARDAG